jgi:hypothetical protein
MINDNRGAALLVCLFALLLLSVLGSLALSNAGSEAKIAFYQQQETAVVYLAEAGLHLMLYWLRHPETAPISIQSLLRPRFLRADGLYSFINEEGISQFSGSPSTPDLKLDIPHQQSIWNPSWTRFFQSLAAVGEISSLKLYAPAVPGAVGTLESTARTAARVEKTVMVQLAQRGDPSVLVPMKGTWHEVP